MILKVFINSLLIQKMKYQISSTGVGYRAFSITLILILPLINVFVLRAEETIKKIELKKTTAGLDTYVTEKKVIAEFSHTQTPQGRPFICNIHTLDGIKVTRNYPITDKDQDDHPHHQGLFHTFSQLNGIDFWHMKGMATPTIYGASEGWKSCLVFCRECLSGPRWRNPSTQRNNELWISHYK